MRRIAVVFVVAVCSPALASAAEVEVAIADFAFSPATLTVEPGTTVVWVNKDGQRHSVKFADQVSPNFGKGGTFKRSFDSAGEFTYKCGRHDNMIGKIVVAKP